MEQLPKKFFIVGCQRSGTTLLRLILESHSSITCKDEPECYYLLSDSKMLISVLKNNLNSEYVGFKIPRFAEQLANSEIFDYGTPKISEPLPNFYEHDPLIFITRDVRDVICSMRELTTNGISWLKVWGEPILNYWVQHSPQFVEKFKSEISLMKNSKHKYIAIGALFWKYKNLSYSEYKELGFPLIHIKYEELIKDPKHTIKQICDFLNLELEESLLQHHLVPHSEIDEHGFAIGNTDSRKPISSSSVRRYCNELTDSELNEISLISGDLMEKFGYC